MILLFGLPLVLYLYDETIKLPFPVYFPGLSNNTFPSYQFNYFSQLHSMLFAVNITIIINSMLITILIHLKYQLDFIGDCMKVVINNVNDDDTTPTTTSKYDCSKKNNIAATSAAAPATTKTTVAATSIELNKVGFMMKILIDLHVDVLK